MSEDLCFEYRNTFICFEEPSEEKPLQRSRSVPPYVGFTCDEEAPTGETRFNYVTSLLKRSEQLAMHIRQSKRDGKKQPFQEPQKIAPQLELCSTTASPHEEASTRGSSKQGAAAPRARVAARGAFLNPGSVGHPEVCNRPCLFFLAGTCQNGASCSYCHLEHAHRQPHLDKKQRTLIQKLPQSSLLNLIVSLLESRAETAAFTKEGGHILEEMKLWEAKCLKLEAASTPQPKRELMKLHYFLRKLTFTGMLGLALRHFETQDLANHPDMQGFPRRLSEALWQMRAELVASG
ncbi:unnamed protein product [Effrenium voratum]|nr:unnamed protein product [Effrenium voratum]|mmetsp:Transcript_121449/g.288592  ORF Transcript_121449/g.288592 Transcript_121449/m.288592 type:complete len:292 (-) Transcript_121449:105-980(-)